MIREYNKFFIRSIKNRKINTLIILLSLSLGYAISLIISFYVKYEYSFDKFHKNFENIYRIKFERFENGELVLESARSFYQLTDYLKTKIPEVQNVTFIYETYAEVTNKDISFREEKLLGVDSSFFNVFSFSVLKGDPKKALKNPLSIILPESIAKKYFGEEDPIGKNLKIDGTNFIVDAITKDPPKNSHLKYSVIFPKGLYQNSLLLAEKECPIIYVYVLLKPNIAETLINEKLKIFAQEFLGKDMEENNYKVVFSLQPLSKIHLFSNLSLETDTNGDGFTVIFMIVFSVILVLIAWINFNNMLTINIFERRHEGAARKILGASSIENFKLILYESFLYNFISIIISILLVFIFSLYFKEYKEIPTFIEIISQGLFWKLITVFAILGTFICGISASFIYALVKPNSFNKTKSSFSRTNKLLGKSLTIFQFLIIIILMSGLFVIERQLKYIKNKDIGIDMKNTFIVYTPTRIPEKFTRNWSYDYFESFKKEVKKIPNVSNICLAHGHPGRDIYWLQSVFRQNSDCNYKRLVDFVGIDHDFFKLFNVDILTGKNFGEIFENERSNIILNEEAVKRLHFNNNEDAINKIVYVTDEFTSESKALKIIGVVKNYHHMSLRQNIRPIVYTFGNFSRNFMVIKIQNANTKDDTFNKIQIIFKRFFPESVLNMFNLDSYYNYQYKNDEKLEKMLSVLNIITIILVISGLIGIANNHINKRTKEIAIRKTLGISSKNILFLLSKDSLKQIVIALILSIPFSYYFAELWLMNFAQRISIGLHIFILPMLLLIMIVYLSIGYFIIGIIRTNPSKKLRDE